MRLAVLALLLLGSCATQIPPTQTELAATEIPNFWFGMWHGLVSWIMLVTEPFDPHRIYAYPNSGGFYDLGWMIGVSFWFGVGRQGR
jgi:hypothetical protein